MRSIWDLIWSRIGIILGILVGVRGQRKWSFEAEWQDEMLYARKYLE